MIWGIYICELEVHIKLISIFLYIFYFLVTDIIVDNVSIKSCSTDIVSSTPEMLVTCGCSSSRVSIVEGYCWFSFELSDNRWDSKRWRNSELKMNMIFWKVSLYFFYLHLFENIIDDISELHFEFSVYNFLTVLWTKYNVIGTVMFCVRHRIEKRLQYIKFILTVSLCKQ
jgi:hypothetical protein